MLRKLVKKIDQGEIQGSVHALTSVGGTENFCKIDP